MLMIAAMQPQELFSTPRGNPMRYLTFTILLVEIEKRGPSRIGAIDKSV
jgi:hypothetical protein